MNYFNKFLTLIKLKKTPQRKLRARWVVDRAAEDAKIAQWTKAGHDAVGYQTMLDQLLAAVADAPEDLFIKPGTPISGCLPFDSSEIGPVGTDRLIRAGIDALPYWLADTEETTSEWHFNNYSEVWWIDENGNEELSGEFVFVRLPGDPIYVGFVVKESMIN
jgi:hypothetical protein